MSVAQLLPFDRPTRLDGEHLRAYLRRSALWLRMQDPIGRRVDDSPCWCGAGCAPSWRHSSECNEAWGIWRTMPDERRPK